MASPRKKKNPNFGLCSTEGESLPRSFSAPGKGRDDREANRGLIRHLTGQVGLVVRQVADHDEVSGRAKDGPVDSHGLLSNLDLSGDNVEAAEGGNSDTLEQKRRKDPRVRTAEGRAGGGPDQGWCVGMDPARSRLGRRR